MYLISVKQLMKCLNQQAGKQIIGQEGKKMDKEAFTAEVLEAEKAMYHVAKSILGKDEDCADAMQDAILSAYGKLHTLKNEAYFKTWLMRILMNRCYRLLRERKATVSYEEYMEESQEAFAAPSFAGESGVFSEVMNLQEKYRIPFILHYVEGYSVREIAKILQISQQNVKVRLYRSRNLLRIRLKGEAYEYGNA